MAESATSHARSPLAADATGAASWSDSEQIPAVRRVQGDPEFKLFVAGPKASGKTVFLASLYNQLSAAGNDAYFYVRPTSTALERLLERNFKTVRGQTDDWPPPDKDITDYTFKCFYPGTSDVEPYQLFRFHYTDFPGGVLSDPELLPEESKFSISKGIREAHAVIFLLDGRKILDALEDRIIKDFNINDDLDTISKYATECVHRPTQFVITKWDILAPNHDLPAIKEFLLQNRKFSNLVNERKRRQKPTYLIPVSAVGLKFAKYDLATGAMIKNKHAAPEPENLDVTLALTITDTLLTSFKTPLTDFDLFLLKLLAVFVGTANAVRWVTKNGVAVSTDPWALSMMVALNRASKRIASVASNMKEEYERRVSKITDRNSALNTITEIQHARVSEFLERYPAANLVS